MANQIHIHIYLFLFIAVLTLMATIVPQVSGKPNMDEVANMAEAIRYLEQLDKYYSQVARPRFGKRSLRNLLKISSNGNGDHSSQVD
ncbi:neuropeptide F-like [Oppia nitens]|uniref:neuropeptide F-like n=1 Tax=Oppia nitens TaxID=1686743 RepID=UPI0023DB5C1D|nr:neuropeptide F-like [Oppia nitens]